MPGVIPANIATTRVNSDAADLEKGLPVQERLGSFVAVTYTTVAADATADTFTVDTGLSEISSKFIQILDSSGVEVPLGDLVVTVSGGEITITEDTSTTIAADWEVNILARGK